MRTVFKIFGYDARNGDNFSGACEFWVYAKSAKEAIEKAKAYGVDKPKYEIIEVMEKHDKDR